MEVNQERGRHGNQDIGDVSQEKEQENPSVIVKESPGNKTKSSTGSVGEL